MRQRLTDAVRRLAIFGANHVTGAPAAQDAAWVDYPGLVITRRVETPAVALLVLRLPIGTNANTVWFRVLVNGVKQGYTLRLSSAGAVDIPACPVFPVPVTPGTWEFKVQTRGGGGMLELGAQGSDKEIFPSMDLVLVPGGGA